VSAFLSQNQIQLCAAKFAAVKPKRILSQPGKKIKAMIFARENYWTFSPFPGNAVVARIAGQKGN
jgi:hypothetical protein